MWSNVYQTIDQTQQMQNMPFNPINNLPQVNPMMMMNNMNMNQFNATDQIQLMSNFFNQNFPQMNMGGNNNFNNMNNNFNMNNNNFNNMNNNNFNMNNNNSPSKFNLCFSTLRGARINMTFNSDETIDGVLTKFLRRVNLDQYIGNTQGKLNFILSAETLRFGDKRKIKDVIFMPSNFTTVLVHDTQNLIGAKNC